MSTVGTGTGDLHRTLRRQLRRLGMSAEYAPGGAEWEKFLHLVSSSYQAADDDRYTLERSMEVASQEMRVLYDVLSHRARHDSLTGLLNRSAMSDVLKEELAASAPCAGPVLLFIDLDGFKVVNDSLGHSLGDELLVRAAERIRLSVRSGDVVARQGGDEFLVVCREVERLDEAVAVAQRISEALAEPFRIGAEDVRVSASIGIAASEGEIIAPDDLIRRADTAMYRAKSAGRSRFVLFDREMQKRVDGRAEMEVALRRAVTRPGELDLRFQPVVRLSDGQPVGYEALLCWNRPGKTPLAAEGFIALAEETSLIGQIDTWVVQEACRQAAVWDDTDLFVSFNLSVRNLHDDRLVGVIADAMHSSDLSPQRVVVELAETVLLAAERPAVMANLLNLEGLGVRIAVDDFGSGCSSLGYLRSVPVHCLKVDGSLLAGVTGEAVMATMVSAIASVGHAVGLSVIAEGVETEAQARRAAELGCDYGQGHYFGHPAPRISTVHRRAGRPRAIAV